MSLTTWQAEFYPVLAEEVRRGHAAEASLLKYQGTLPSALKRHGGVLDHDVLAFANEHFFFDETTCALCWQYSCDDCPVRYCGDQGSPFAAFLRGDPKPILAALRKATRLEKKARKDAK